jgi:ArsR family transcriptional regulator
MNFDSKCAGCFAGLSSGIRVEIINLLQAKKRLSVMEITKNFDLTQPTITHHLKYLKNAGVLKSQKEGRKIYYYIDPKCSDSCGVF